MIRERRPEARANRRSRLGPALKIPNLIGTQTMSNTKSGRSIAWYRPPVERTHLKELNRRSDARALVQTLGHLVPMWGAGALAIYASFHFHWVFVVLLVFLYGTMSNFMINGVHELGHGTVFKTKSLNRFFNRVMSFFGWINFHAFAASHTRHHAYTLHPPDDLEVVLPIKLLFRHFFYYGFINIQAPRWFITNNIRLARGKFQGEWESAVLPESDPELRRRVVNWSRFLLIGHGLVFAGSAALAIWVDPRWLLLSLMVNFGNCYGAWLQWLCNNTQHVGLQDNVADFRLNCRTFLLNPVAGLLYWQMNYHTEHHMYPTVPCYNLGRLHQSIKQEMPPAANGLVAVWREILAILRKQEQDPDYKHVQVVPARTQAAVETVASDELSAV